MFKNQRSSILYLALIMSFRMLGLFMVLPVLSAHADHFSGATPARIGLALGIYGLTQATLQMPFAALSDRIGRRPVIAFGLFLFVVGSVLAALSHSITGLIAGRALQGSGAIGSTVLALVADLTPDETRSQAMACVGLSIGLAFAAAMVLGPLIHAWFGLPGIFWATAAMACTGLLFLSRLSVPTPHAFHGKPYVSTPSGIKQVVTTAQLLRLNMGIFSLHFILTVLFMAVPILFKKVLYIAPPQQTSIYLLVLLASFVLVFPVILYAEKKRRVKLVFLTAIVTLLITQVLFYFYHAQYAAVVILLFLFFAAFTLLEATLPSLVSKIAPVQHKGAAMGIYSTAQFVGIFLGGALGGMVLNYDALQDLFLLGAVMAFLWLLIALTMKQPPYLSTVLLEIKQMHPNLANSLKKIPGVAEVSYSAAENLLYMKIDRVMLSERELRKRVEAVKL